jgi:hypothetical protein
VRQFQVKDDNDKFLQTSREAAQQLEHLFEADSSDDVEETGQHQAAGPASA